VKTLLAVSPHLDDAVFSAGALLARRARAGWRVVVATCFTASVPNPTGFALACQLDKGLGPQVDYMALRREEDRNACALLGAEAVHLPFPEAPHRGYGSAAALFGPRLASDRMADTLSEALADMIAACEPNLLLGPAAIGDHVDHWIVREALARTASAPAAVWADLPYAARRPDALPDAFARFPCGPALEHKATAARAYQSQLGFQFGGSDDMARLLSLNGAEAFSVAQAHLPTAAPDRNRA
jgi:LmbE family N-acetylglucosaminyl deacetylase